MNNSLLQVGSSFSLAICAARQKDKATESVTELVGAFKKPPHPVTPSASDISTPFQISPMLPTKSPYGYGHRRSSEPFRGSQKLSGLDELGVESATSRSKRTSGFLSLLGYVLFRVHLLGFLLAWLWRESRSIARELVSTLIETKSCLGMEKNFRMLSPLFVEVFLWNFQLLILKRCVPPVGWERSRNGSWRM